MAATLYFAHIFLIWQSRVTRRGESDSEPSRPIWNPESFSSKANGFRLRISPLWHSQHSWSDPGNAYRARSCAGACGPTTEWVEFDQGLHAIINRLREALRSEAGGSVSSRHCRVEATGLRAPCSVRVSVSRRISATRGLGSVDERPTGLQSLLCMLAGSVVVLVPRARPDGSPRVEPLTSLIGREVAPAFTPDGERLLFAWNGDADSGGAFRSLQQARGSERLLRLTHDSAAALRAAWAPGGAQLALARQTDRDSGVYIAPIWWSGAPASPCSFSERALHAVELVARWTPDRLCGDRLRLAAATFTWPMRQVPEGVRSTGLPPVLIRVPRLTQPTVAGSASYALRVSAFTLFMSWNCPRAPCGRWLPCKVTRRDSPGRRRAMLSSSTANWKRQCNSGA